MIGYVTLGSNDLPQAFAFYDELLALLGARRVMEFDGNGVMWGAAMNEPLMCVLRPNNGNEATVGNGVMVALSAGSQEKVAELYAKALELGGTCEGKPGLRGDTFYGAYFRDLDGNKLAAFCIVPK